MHAYISYLAYLLALQKRHLLESLFACTRMVAHTYYTGVAFDVCALRTCIT